MQRLGEDEPFFIVLRVVGAIVCVALLAVSLGLAYDTRNASYLFGLGFAYVAYLLVRGGSD